ncbi:F-box/kelch-repeat protein At3g23880-like [Silene latifolia]|uniref:F-box/kelch-repeat protein At3g23880-like n=1 Tax=Silene latifolia TaxID=37657 RepID=UPI003D77E90C
MGDESGCLVNIPEELVSEILCYLPVKLLIRFTIVCKSWLCLIRNNHCFAMKNYLIRCTSSSKVLDNADYMFDNLVKSDNPCLYSFTQAKSFRFLKKFECVPNEKIGVSNSCHGIICIHLFRKSEIFLYNPSIQEVVLLPPCPNNGKKALGFDPIQNDYKVVAIDFPNTDNYLCRVNLYSLRHGHWRKLYTSISLRCTHGIEGDGASNANGRIYNWLFNKQHGMEKKKLGLLSFDMTEEVLKEFPMPKCEDPHLHDHELLSSTRWQACLICLPKSYYFTHGFIDVWVLKDWIWSKAIVIKFPDRELMQPSKFWINDNELFVNVEKGNTIEVFHYNLATKKLKFTGRKGSLWCSRGYVESLVSLKRLMSLHHESKHGEDGKQINDQVEVASKQEDTSRYVLREVSRKGVRWSQTST